MFNKTNENIILSDWLNSKPEELKLVGLKSFDTFLKVISNFSDIILDDIGLANRNNAYKIWTTWIKPDKIKDIKEVIERYSSMKLLKHYYDINIIETKKIGLYIKLDWIENKWEMSYGITNDKKLYKVGEFEYNFTTKLPESKILKYLLDEIDDFNPREHLKLFKIKKDLALFVPGYCQILDPQIINKEIILTTYNLGQWLDNGQLVNGEADKYIKIFKDFVKNQTWWQDCHLVLRPQRAAKIIQFVIKLK